MTVTTVPLFLQAGSHPAQELRQLIAADNPPGIVNPGDLLVAQRGGTINMSVDVAAGAARIAGTTVPATQGSYFFYNDATVNVGIGASDATQARNDLVCARIRDTTVDGSGFNVADLFVQAGTLGGGDPAAPTNSLVLARVRVVAGVASIDNAHIDDLRGGSVRQRYAKRHATADTTVGAATWTTIILQASDFDPSTMGGNNGFTAPVTGTYRIEGNIYLNSGSAVGVAMTIGWGIGGANQGQWALANVVTLVQISGSDLVRLTAGQVVNLQAYLASGAAGAIRGTFNIAYVGP